MAGRSVTAVPSVALQWIVHNSISSNTELSALSNVSRAWRNAVVECLVDDAVDDKPGLQTQFSCSRLLVPSWIRQFCASSLKDPSLRQTTEERINDEEDEDQDTYCVAWFHPDGIQSKYVLPANSNPAAVDEVRLLVQWNGFSDAIDVLSPFGFNYSFLQKVIQETLRRINHDGLHSEAINNENKRQPEDSSISSLPIAVRGAISARPEGYPKSWDEKDADELDDPHTSVLKIQKPLRKEDLERLVLPKVLPNDDDLPNPFVQFLNIDSNHAIRLLTPKFKSPVFTPITVFCVAIATEDGCFFSGLNEELAMGHMYPTTPNEKISDDRSPICLSADYAERSRNQEKTQQVLENRDNIHNHIQDAYLGSDSDVMITEGSESDSSDSSDDSSDVECAANAVSGQLGPGAWHCYTGVFDGYQSIIRVDGEEESTTFTSAIPPSFRACLDGITIGSDHAFDMSLCFGQGSEGEGEGAIAELAIFKGRLPVDDISLIESHLMAKHGISVPAVPRSKRIRDDFYSRLAHKLMEQTPARARRNKSTIGHSVPLKYMTELRHVAWKQTDPVTGMRRGIKQIGDKRLHTGSTTSE